jgi:hypothetical protein
VTDFFQDIGKKIGGSHIFPSMSSARGAPGSGDEADDVVVPGAEVVFVVFCFAIQVLPPLPGFSSKHLPS